MAHSQDLEELLSSLPACCRCRLNRRRCDTQLPSCQNCSKAGAECVFFDHVLQQNQPRAYVATLISRLKEKRGELAARTGRESSGGSLTCSPSSDSRRTSSRCGLQTSRYIGNRSCLSWPLSVVNDTAETTTLAPPPLEVEEKLNSDINQDVHWYLMMIYMDNIQPVYPVIEESLPFLSSNWLIDRDLDSLDARQLFTLDLVHSIASRDIIDNISTDQRQSYRVLADECHRRALVLFDKAATDISIPTLQAVILATLHSLFSPQQGNCEQLIGLAVRLAMELHASDKQARSDEGRIQQLYRVTYCIENQVATTLDRPALLPEPRREYRSDTSIQDTLCDLYRMQSRFRSNPDDEEAVASLSEELSSRIKYLEEITIDRNTNVLATAYETRLLLSPNDNEAAARLIEAYGQPHYIRTFLSPQWAYRAGVVISTAWKGSGPAVQAYGRCLVFLEQCSRTWPSASALKQSLESFASR
ncbi:hypothetical protein ASPVEDRAFT_81103 [Aspergillus versicolor CBS 583.65]|uniref:Zn(2)-C6 fungal-type domain-containing protein n=1 Tax=Aspergillus versicolor CBS 583.65 TaxID=1036611 RepID=A0A1L9PDC5_ASPVE|nr:uncharacterized protein ASPVEDRAFT_81103 [Aspergillus versicolor CBS 583.65]OJI99491.1 hypothetical protein ASPVEDRAFT_81103 [Aspergillus versicolor CBS 583.65]